MLSIKDVAHYVGYSTSTVSRVINNRDAVDPETKQKVIQAIEELEYKPNLVAQGLRTKRGNLIGLVVPNAGTPAFGAIIQSTLETTFMKEFNFITVNSHENPEEEEELISNLLRRNINGIVFSRVSDESKILPKIVKKNIPVVVLDRAFENEKVSNVVLNNYEAGYIAGKYLVDLGHREIACITGPMKITLCRERLQGFIHALQEKDIELCDECIFEGKFDFASGIEAVDKLETKRCFYTAVWALNDMMAFGVLKQLGRHGKRIPHEISVLGLDDLQFCSMVSPSLSSIHNPLDILVNKALHLLLRQIDEKCILNDTIVVEPSLTIRESTSAAQK